MYSEEIEILLRSGLNWILSLLSTNQLHIIAHMLQKEYKNNKSYSFYWDQYLKSYLNSLSSKLFLLQRALSASCKTEKNPVGLWFSKNIKQRGGGEGGDVRTWKVQGYLRNSMWLFNRSDKKHEMNRIQSRDYIIGTYRITKISLSCYNDKRWI